MTAIDLLFVLFFVGRSVYCRSKNDPLPRSHNIELWSDDAEIIETIRGDATLFIDGSTT